MNSQLSLSLENDQPRMLQVAVPTLPRAVRYVDDYTDQDHTVADPSATTWRVSNNGAQANLRFDRYKTDLNLQRLIQAFAADSMTRSAAPTARLYIDSLANVDLEDIINLVECAPENSRTVWDSLRAKIRRSEPFSALKALLKFVAERRIGMWNPRYITFISSSLPMPPRDKYAAVRSGNVFISIQHEAELVRWIEEQATAAPALSLNALIDAAMIICSYQFAMRPKQIGLLRRRDCRVIDIGGAGETVHLSFRMIKQRTAISQRMQLVRKVKREWAPIFVEILRKTDGQNGDVHLFGYADTRSISKRICALLFEITKDEWTPTDLRHSGAMRLVDAGASAEELAEFMGHSSLETGMIYYDSSATQAQRVNEALGISETYRHVAKYGTSNFISPEELRRLKGDDQIAGVPHGIPIAGIGACKTGQPACKFNPVTACYGCPKFIPVSDVKIHTEALRSFREVVNFFHSSSRAENDNPAFLQLKRTISDVQGVISDLEENNVR